MYKLGRETRFLLIGMAIIFIISTLFSYGIAVWLTKDFQRSMILHDYETAGYLLREKQSSQIASAFTKDKNNEDFENGKKLLEMVGYKEQTAMNLLPAVQNYRNKTVLTLFVFTFSICLSVFIIFYLYLRKQRHTLGAAELAVREFLDGNTTSRIESGQDGDWDRFFHEVNGFTTILNAHVETEKHTKEFLQDMVSDIFHQLKTPLAALKMYCEIIYDDRSNEAVVMEFCGKSENEIERIEDFIGTLLRLAKLDAGSIQLNKNQENILELLQDITERFEAQTRRENKMIDLVGNDSATLYCDALWLSEAIGNIVKNALEHMEDNGCIIISWDTTPLMTSIIIEDNGTGIHPADVHSIFKRFYRSRFSKDRQGIGLGLPLAKSIVEAHGGTLTVKSALGKGSIFSLDFFNLSEM